MKNLLFVGIIALGATVALGANLQPNGVVKPSDIMRKKYSDLSPEEKAERAKRFAALKYKKTGGLIVQPGSQKGSVAFYDAQKTFNETNAIAVSAELAKFLKLNVQSKSLAFQPTKMQASEILKEKGDSFGIFIIDDKNDPTTLSIFPEQRYAFVNAVAVGGNDRRFQRELKRAFAFLCGAAGSQYQDTLMGPVVAPIDIDTIQTERLPIDLIQRIQTYLKAFDVTPSRTRTYWQGVQEGWAHQPTNEVEKAIWDQIHSIPTKPLTIER